MTTTQPPRRLTFILPKRYCANRQCGKLLEQGAKYATCSWRCKVAVDAELAAIEAADKAAMEDPF